MRGKHDGLETTANQVRLLATSYFVAASVRVAHQTCSVHDCDQALRVIQDLGIEVVFAQELRLHMLDFGDVEENAAVLHHLSGITAHHEAVLQHVNDRALPPDKSKLVVCHAAKVMKRTHERSAIAGPLIGLVILIVQELFAYATA